MHQFFNVLTVIDRNANRCISRHLYLRVVQQTQQQPKYLLYIMVYLCNKIIGIQKIVLKSSFQKRLFLSDTKYNINIYLCEFNEKLKKNNAYLISRW